MHLRRQYAIVYDGNKLYRASDHADLLEMFVEDDMQDTEEDPRELFPSDFLIGVEYLDDEDNLLYEIISFTDKTIRSFIENISDNLFVFNYDFMELLPFVIN